MLRRLKLFEKWVTCAGADRGGRCGRRPPGLPLQTTDQDLSWDRVLWSSGFTPHHTLAPSGCAGVSNEQGETG